MREYAGHELRAFFNFRNMDQLIWTMPEDQADIYTDLIWKNTPQAREVMCLDMDAGGSTDSYSESFFIEHKKSIFDRRLKDCVMVIAFYFFRRLGLSQNNFSLVNHCRNP